MVSLGISQDPVEDAYEMGDELGRGKFGIVMKCKSKKNDEEFAAKFIRKRKTRVGRGQKVEDIYKEIEIMQALGGNTCVVTLEAVYEDKTNVVMVMELLRGTELFTVMAREDHFSEAEAIKYIKQLLNGVAYIHQKGYIHLDLKPENIVLQDETAQKLKIIDFGLAMKYAPNQKPKEIVGTPEFMAPESISFEPTSPATDMWAVGVITYILVSGCSPFLGDDDIETYGNITSGEVEFPDEYFSCLSPEAEPFICQLFAPKPKDRLSAEDCLKNKWLAPKESKNFKRIGTKRLRSFNANRKAGTPAGSDVSVGGAFLDVYEVGEEMARGKFGVVSRCTNKKTHEEYVAKVISKRRGRTLGRQVDDIYTEIDVLKELRGHQRIVSLAAVFDESLHIILVMEALKGGELLPMVADMESFTEKDTIIIIEQILNGVTFIHKKGYMHLDLQPSNIILTDISTKDIKIIDFSTVQRYDPEAMPLEIEGSPEFMAPETISFAPPTPAVDIWAIGVITYILLSGCSPFAAADETLTYKNIAEGQISFPDNMFASLSTSSKYFIQSLLQLDPSARPAAEQATQHTWMKEKDKHGSIRIRSSPHRAYISQHQRQGAGDKSTLRRVSVGTSVSDSSMQPTPPAQPVKAAPKSSHAINFCSLPTTVEESLAAAPDSPASTHNIPTSTSSSSLAKEKGKLSSVLHALKAKKDKYNKTKVGRRASSEALS